MSLGATQSAPALAYASAAAAKAARDHAWPASSSPHCSHQGHHGGRFAGAAGHHVFLDGAQRARIARYLQHMRTEEEQILPLAERLLEIGVPGKRTGCRTQEDALALAKAMASG